MSYGYVEGEALAAMQAAWDECEYVLRENIGAPEWAQFVDRDGTAYSVEALAEEQLQGDAQKALDLLIAISPTAAAHVITTSLMERVVAGELRAVGDSPDDWK